MRQNAKYTTFTSESVCSGHPDKLCDQISDSIVDAVLSVDQEGRVAVETLATFNQLILAGEVTSKIKVDYKSIAQNEIKRLGYIKKEYNFWHNSPISVFIHNQSPEIAVGVKTLGAGDQGMMFGFACNETKNYMPMPIEISHKLAQKIDEVRESKLIPYLHPDGKTQVTILYEKGKAIGIQNIVLAAPHDKEVILNKVKEDLFNNVIVPVISEYGFNYKISDLIVNGTGVWHTGGPAADTGLTGRKIIVDTYGGYARVGGGCFSGKDPTKVDRSGAYAARFIAKNIVAQGLSDKAEVRLAYFIGAKKPLMQEVETFGTAKVSNKAIKDFTKKILDTSVSGILNTLNLRRPIYRETASYGHFGRSNFPWETIVS